jgi:hypothetical protein
MMESSTANVPLITTTTPARTQYEAIYIDVPLPKTNTKIRLLAIHTEKEDDDDEIHCSLFVCYIQDAEFVAL